MSTIGTPRKKYPNVSPELAQAMLDVIQAMSERDHAQLPSVAVQTKALEILDLSPNKRRVSTNVAKAKVTKVGDYRVIMYVQGGRISDEEIVDAECTCPATTTCKHLLIALTYAQRAGLPLAT